MMADTSDNSKDIDDEQKDSKKYVKYSSILKVYQYWKRFFGFKEYVIVPFYFEYYIDDSFCLLTLTYIIHFW